jgi:hypothetical protein
MHFNAQRLTLNSERSIQSVGRLLAIYRSWAPARDLSELNVEHWTFPLQ